MLVYILVFILLLSLIPSFRETAKKVLRILYIIAGIGLLLIELSMDFLIYPKLAALYQSSNLPFDNTRLTIYLGVGTVLSVAVLLIGLKFKKFSQNNVVFYSLFAFLIVAIALVVQFSITAVILPIYQLTSSINYK